MIPWVRKIPWRRKWEPTPVLLPEKFREWRSLVGYSPWGCKELDTIEVTACTPGKAMALHSSTLAWKIPWKEEPGRIQSMG